MRFVIFLVVDGLARGRDGVLFRRETRESWIEPWMIVW